MRILGIDPGLRFTGYALIEKEDENLKLLEAGIINTYPERRIYLRLGIIYKKLLEVIEKYRPHCIVLEKLYVHKHHPATASLLAHVRGVICVLAAEKKIAFSQYSPTRIKKAIVGRGSASKIQLQRMVEHILGLKRIKSQDLSDAMALALTHFYISKDDCKNLW